MEAIDEVSKNCRICSLYRSEIGSGKVTKDCAAYEQEQVNDKSSAHDKVCSMSPQKQRDYLELLSLSEEGIPECKDSRVGKSGQPIQLDSDDTIECVDWPEHVAEWREDTAPGREEGVLLPSVCMFEQEVTDVNQAELEKLKYSDEMEEVKYADQSTIGAQWVAMKKADGSVNFTLIAMSHQERYMVK